MKIRRVVVFDGESLGGGITTYSTPLIDVSQISPPMAGYGSMQYKHVGDVSNLLTISMLCTIDGENLYVPDGFGNIKTDLPGGSEGITPVRIPMCIKFQICIALSISLSPSVVTIEMAVG